MNNSNLNLLVEEKRSLLKHFAGKFTTDPDEKEDLIQETLIRALKSIDDFIKHPKLMSWLYVIMKNVYINQYRKAKRTSDIHETYIGLEAYKTTEANKGENKFVSDDIEKAMCGLSEDNYQIFQLFLEGYKYHEIASYLGMPEGTIKTRIHMTRKKLQKQLKVYRIQ
ncbi:RNA polymerase sigma factor [Sphingobacterium puteale]|uniref:RNA polymerase sigma factor n=1 Tax=Sphingobacterium puteale TaxID=2420510 RepID=A0A420VXL6_9SPHI|nr:RNA polymerase sigma factor [Sphingobacterium puteale]RKO71101.1 RNA polymerase sigma factor [Sphingobacterium puteale]